MTPDGHRARRAGACHRGPPLGTSFGGVSTLELCLILEQFKNAF